MAAEIVAAHRERLRGEGPEYGLLVERLERVETHLVWVLEQVEIVAGDLEGRGWTPPPLAPPPPDTPWGSSPSRHPTDPGLE